MSTKTQTVYSDEQLAELERMIDAEAKK